MESPDSRASNPQQGSLAFGTPAENGSNEVPRDLSADPNTLTVIPENKPSPPAGSIPPVWGQRLTLIIFVTACLYLGLFLLVVPWKELWLSNRLLAYMPELRPIMQNYFFRGIVSGLGLLDIWIGISEAIHYREQKPVKR